ncbi:MAG TPA: hypothetical protein VHS59_13590 [Bacillota bacterium]|nr:hypothetical protein [Bacillota bacterium]
MTSKIALPALMWRPATRAAFDILSNGAILLSPGTKTSWNCFARRSTTGGGPPRLV